MKAKCPCCENGCSRCKNGYLEVSFPKDKLLWHRVCLNFEECGFVNGGYFSEDFPLESSGPCVICDGITEWRPPENTPNVKAWQKPENYSKWSIKSLEKQVESLRQSNESLRQIGRKFLDGNFELTLDECRLLRVCRICKKPESTPFMYNYGKEYAHTECLKKEKNE